MLIAPIHPVYPMIAKAARVEGTVVVEAVISRTGTIESLHVVSGPVMLQGAAIDAIREARYQPYRLNGEPTEVQTVITGELSDGRVRGCFEQTAGPSTAPLAIRPREASLRMTLLFFFKFKERTQAEANSGSLRMTPLMPAQKH